MSNNSVRIHPVVSDNDTRRLHYFAGRYLSEQEFDIMQAYVDERCEDLLVARPAGIVHGLEVELDPNLEQNLVKVNPGLAVSQSGKAVAARFAIYANFQAIADYYQAEQAALKKNPPALQGYYFLTLRRKVHIVDDTTNADPCTRTEQDPLRDSRLETFAQLSLQFISASPLWMSFSRQRACMRILKMHLDPHEFAKNDDEIKLAVVKIDNKNLVWIDPHAGRFYSQADAVYYTLLNYWNLIVNAEGFRLDTPEVELTDANQTLGQLLDVDYLPAAGPFPAALIAHLAGRESELDHHLWSRPTLGFNPADLQIELLPVPANAVQGVISQELNRGVVDLTHFQADRIRLMVAVNPDDYHAKLMDLPAIDKELLKDLYGRRYEAMQAYVNWAKEFYKLYNNVDQDAQFTGDTPSAETRELFNSMYWVSSPAGALPMVNTPAKHQSLNLPPAQAEPQLATLYLDSLVAQRSARLDEADKVPRPYSIRDQVAHTDEEVGGGARPLEDGTYRKRALLKKDIEKIEAFILEANQLIDEVSDFLSLQRQQLDSITVSFATLAGGIPGDGSGLKLMRWADKVKYEPTRAAGENDNG